MATLTKSTVHALLLIGLVVVSRTLASPDAASCVPSWLPTFGPAPAVDGPVLALTVFDDGSGDGPALYAGGDFTVVGGTAAAHVARWNGTAWSPLGTGTDGPVLTLVAFDDGSGAGSQLYAGGVFTEAGGNVVNNVARWDGKTWSSLGGGMDEAVTVLATYSDGEGRGPGLYAGGGFTTAGGIRANRIARWNGFYWSPLAGGTNNTVNTLATFGEGSVGGALLDAGGDFTAASGILSNHVACWNGTSWASLGPGFNNSVFSLMPFDDGTGGGRALYAAGGFTSSGGVSMNRIARWNGTAWSPLGSGLGGLVLALASFEDGLGGGSGDGPALFAGGIFTSAGGSSANRIARWNGTTWSPLGSGADSVVFALQSAGDEVLGGSALYVGGAFTVTPAGDSFLAKWAGCANSCGPDLDHDGVVGGGDLAILLGGWGSTDATLDLDHDGLVAGGDLAVLLGAWGDC